ncbi:MAG TPA: hypothetical protein VL633_08370 [Bacteroidota bacterium]|jgi:hypothetical protein|nr:hypothetical protein [Bacteroidota bacterium]
MEKESKPAKHKRGSSPPQTAEEVYRTWLQRPGTNVIAPPEKDSPAKEGTDPAPSAKTA